MTRAEALWALWRERDRRYSMRRTLSDGEVQALLMWRQHEVEPLPPGDRSSMLAELARWARPFGMVTALVRR